MPKAFFNMSLSSLVIANSLRSLAISASTGFKYPKVGEKSRPIFLK
jgi:hypothetical protein